jgi:hypothetical protein
MYMQTSSVADGCKIFVVEEIIYEILFANCFKQSELRKIRLGNISPVLGALIEKSQKGMILETVIIRPSSISESQHAKDIHDDNFLEDLV